MAKQEVEKARKLKDSSSDPDKAKREEGQATKNREAWQAWLTEYVQILASCPEIKEYGSVEEYEAAKRQSMNGRVNPEFILRNYLLENAIQKAEAGDYSLVN